MPNGEEPGRHDLVLLPSHETILGKQVCPLVFGTAAYGAGRPQDPVTKFFPYRLDQFDEEVELLQDAIGIGYNVIDTAEAYGASEQIVGEAIRGVNRDSLVIATKVGIRFDPDSPHSVTDSIMKSAER